MEFDSIPFDIIVIVDVDSREEILLRCQSRHSINKIP